MPRWGAAAAIGGFLAGTILGSLAASIWLGLSGDRSGVANSYGGEIAGLIGLWTGLLGAALVVTAPRGGLVRALGLRFRPIDVPVGVGVGLFCQFPMVWILYLPLRIFAPGTYRHLGDAASQLTKVAHGAGFVVLGVLIALGAPLVEEIFFRGLFQRSMAGAYPAPVAIGASALFFGLAHFEALQLLALVAFGVVLGVLAHRTGRLGPGIVAHVTFNTATVVILAALR